MATSKKLKSTKKRVNVKDMPASEKKLSGKDMKKVKGGASDYLLTLDGVKGESSDKKRK